MEVLILTGACGVGKTTLARAWARHKQGAVVESDYFTEWILKEDFPHWTREEEIFTAKLAARVALEYLRFPMPVAIENVWSPTGLELLRQMLAPDPLVRSLTFVWLECRLPENQARDAQRPPSDQMGRRVAVVRQELQAYDWPEYVRRVDSSGLSVCETLRTIEDLEE